MYNLRYSSILSMMSMIFVVLPGAFLRSHKDLTQRDLEKAALIMFYVTIRLLSEGKSLRPAFRRKTLKGTKTSWYT